MAYGAIIGGLLGAGANVAGGFLGQSDPAPSSNMVNVTYDPTMDPSIAAAMTDSLMGIGYADVLNQPDPFQTMANRINGLSMDEKNKRRALVELAEFKENIELRSLPDDYRGGTISAYDNAIGEGPQFSFGGRSLREAMGRLGVTFEDLTNQKLRTDRILAERQKLVDAGLDGVQTDIILNRMNAQRDLSEIAAGALSDRDSPIMRTLRERMMLDRTRGLDEAQERAELRGRFGGFNPSAQLEGIDTLRSRLSTDVDFESTMQALGLAGSVSQLLSAGTAAAQGQAGLAASSNLGALGIAANQAAASNQLRTSIGINNADSLANGIGAAGNTLGSAVLLASDSLSRGGQNTTAQAPTLIQSGGGWQGTSNWSGFDSRNG